MIFNMMGGGANKLRLDIKAVPPAAQLPAVGEEGDVLAVTEVELSGTVFFQPDQPTGTGEVGDVWFQTNEASPVTMNLLKEGSIVVGLSFAHVRTESGWTRTAFYMWNGSSWVDAAKAGYLVANGMLNTSFSAKDAVITQSEGYIRARNKSGASGYYRTEEGIDLTEYTTIKFRGYNVSKNIVGSVAVWKETNAEKEPDKKVRMPSVESTVSMDISDLAGVWRVGVHGNNQTSGGLAPFDIRIYELWLE